MTYPKELREDTRLDEKNYPIQLFDNILPKTREGQNVLYLHWHEHFEIIALRQGRAVFHINSQAYEAAPGDVLFVPPGGLHVGYSRMDGPVHYASIVFNSSLYSNLTQDSIHEQFVAPYLEGRQQLPVQPDRPQPACRAYYALLDDMLEELRMKRPAYQLIVKSLLHLLLAQLARLFPPQALSVRSREQDITSRSRFKALIQYVDEHYMEKWTVEQAALRVNLNPYHFCKIFKKLTGRTFIEHINMSRVNEAEQLLLGSDLSITEVAGLVGCDNPNYFTKLFKQYKGMTPSALRRMADSRHHLAGAIHTAFSEVEKDDGKH